MKKYMRWLRLVLIVTVVTFVLPTQALAATALDSPYTDVSASVDGSTTLGQAAYSTEVSTGTIILEVTGGFSDPDYATLTLANVGNETAVLSFTYSATGSVNTFTIAGTTPTSNSGKYSVNLSAGDSVAIYLKTPKRKKATVTLTDIKLEVVSAANVTVSHNGYGTVSVGGTETASGTTVEVAAEGTTIAATPASGATFLGWVNAADNSVVSTSASLNYVPTGDASLKAIFAKTDSNACFWGSSNTYLFDSLLDATAHASNVTDKTIVLAADGTLPAGNYTIPSGVKFLIPYKDGDTGMFVEPTASNGYLNETKGTTAVYRTMTMANGANLTVNGIMNVNAQQYVSTTPNTNQVADGYGCIKMNSGSTITIGNGGTLYCYGYIWGDGTVEAVSGAKVYERLETQDWRGGTVTSEWKDKYDCFVISQYYVQNIEADYIVNAGAKSYSSIGIQASLTTQVSNPMYIGASGDSALFNLSSGKLIRSYDGKTDRMTYDVYGDFTFNSLSMSISSIASINSKDYILPLNNAITLNMNSGTLTIKYPVKMLPGSQVNITSNANMAIESTGAMYIYDAADISGTTSDGTSKSYYYTGIQGAAYSPTRTANSGKRTTPYASAQLVIDGTVTANGPVYTSEQAGTDVNKVLKGSGTFYNNYSSYSESVEIDELWQDSWSTTYGALTVKCVPVVGHLAGISTDSTYTSLSNGTYYGLPTNYWYQWKVTGEGIAITGDHKLDDSTGVAATGGSVTFTVAKGSTATASNGELTAAEDGVTYTLSNISEDTAVTVTGACTHEGTVNAFAEIPATCVDDGNRAYWQCTNCGKYFSDEACTTEIPDLDAWLADETETGGKLAAIGHSYGEATYTWTDYSACVATRTCTVCTEETECHTETASATITSKVTKEATCSAAGEMTYTATFDKDWATTQTATEEIAADSNAHSWDNDCDTDCNNGCGTTREITHSYKSVVTAPTCTSGGYTTHTCSVCGDSYTDGETSALGCSYSDKWETDSDNHWHACSVCGEESDKAAHADGNSDHKCDTCEYVMSECSFTVKGELKTAGTCMAEAVYQAKCSVCGAVSETETIKGEKDSSNHTGNNHTENAEDANCTEAGYTGDTVCECGATVADGTAIEATGHQHTTTTTVDATCTTDGSKTVTCDDCGTTISTETIPAAGHSYSYVVTAPTCEADGFTTYTCTCGDSYTGDTVAKLGHDYELTDSKEASCTEDGYKTYTCKNDASHTYTDTLTKTGHSYESVVTVPTHTEAGYTTYTCSVCGDTYKADEVAATGHSYTSDVTTEPTCTEKGVKTFTCTCGDTYTEDITALGHAEVSHEAKTATCTEIGWDAYVTCSRCDYSTYAEIAALGHTEGAVVVENEKVATCTAEGSYDNVVYCTECDVELSRETKALELAAHTEGAVVVENEVAATCTAEGSYDNVVYCSVCNEELSRDTVTVEKIAHTPAAAVEENRVESTCTVAGSYDSVVYCSVCDAELSRETVTVDALGHKYESVVTDPTCTEAGYTTYTCSVCGDTYTGNNVTANGHSYENGTCTVCGEADPDYSVGVTVSFVNYTVTGKTPATISVGGTAVSTTTQAVGVSATLGIDRTFIVESTQSVVVAYTTNGTDYTEIPVSDVANTYVLPDEATGDIRIAVAFCGDGNLDGALDGKDITLIRRDILTEGTYLSGLKRIAADIKLDDVLDGKDITMIRRYILSNT